MYKTREGEVADMTQFDADDLTFSEEEIDEIANDLESQRQEKLKSKKPKSEKRQRGVMVSVRMTSSEYETISNIAESVGLTVGTYLRNCALGDAQSGLHSYSPSFVRTTSFFEFEAAPGLRVGFSESGLIATNPTNWTRANESQSA